MWKLQTEANDKRIYTNLTTNSRCETDLLKVDREGNKWWGFNDLLTMPFPRHFASTKVFSLYALGFTKDDILNTISSLKKMLNSSDAEKYQKSYALVLDFEAKATNAIDPIRQMTSLVCVYYLFNDESIDSFEGALQAKKMGILENDPELHSFFLIRQRDAIESYMNHLAVISRTSSPEVKELSEVSQ